MAKKVTTKDVMEKINKIAEKEHPEDDIPVVYDKNGKAILVESEQGEREKTRHLASQITGAKIKERNFDDTWDELEHLIDTYVLAAKRGDFYECSMIDLEGVGIKAFIETYSPTIADDGTQEASIAKSILMVAKSTYEYTPGVRILSDQDYDTLMAAWKKFHVEPTGIVPTGKPGKEKVKIRYETLTNNLDKAYRIGKKDGIPNGVKEEDSVEDFIDRCFKAAGTDTLSLILSPKIDGVSVNSLVSEGRLTNPASRGDADGSMRLKGLEGFYVSKKRDHEPFAIQYEAFVTKENKKRLNAATGIAYINCRSAASGIINRMAADENAKDLMRYLSLYPITSYQMSDTPMTYSESLSYIDQFGRVPKDMIKRFVVTGDKKTLLKEIRDKFAEYEKRRDKLTYEIDGMVISVMDDSIQEIMGREGRTNLFQIAMKFQPQSTIATVKDVSVSVDARKGSRTIMVELEEPAVIEGVSYPFVQWLSATGYDALGLRKGSKIEVVRTGDVMPTFTMVETGDGELIPRPTKCPSCGEDLKMFNGRLYCDNDLCVANIVGRFCTVFEKLGLENYSDSFAARLVTQGKITNLMDLLHTKQEDLTARDIKGKIEDQFVEVFHKNLSEATDFQIINALGLPRIGSEISRKLAKLIDFTKIDELTIDDITGILKGAGGFKETASIIANTIVTNKELIKAYIGESKVGRTDFEHMKLIGQTGVRLDAEAVQKIRAHGWDVTDRQGQFHLLVVSDIYYKGEKDNESVKESRKLKKAKKEGIPIMPISEFMKHIDDLDSIFEHRLTVADSTTIDPKIKETIAEAGAIAKEITESAEAATEETPVAEEDKTEDKPKTRLDAAKDTLEYLKKQRETIAEMVSAVYDVPSTAELIKKIDEEIEKEEKLAEAGVDPDDEDLKPTGTVGIDWLKKKPESEQDTEVDEEVVEEAVKILKVIDDGIKEQKKIVKTEEELERIRKEREERAAELRKARSEAKAALAQAHFDNAMLDVNQAVTKVTETVRDAGCEVLVGAGEAVCTGVDIVTDVACGALDLVGGIVDGFLSIFD